MRAQEAEAIGPNQRNFTVQGDETENRKLYESELQLVEDDAGVTLVEYGLVVGFIALASIVAMTTLKTNIATLLGAIGNQLMSSS